VTELSCSQCRKLAAELALNIVTGRERAAALAHLDQCDPCRRHVAQLAQTVDHLVELLPEKDPPAGFEMRTTAKLAPPARQNRPRLPPIAAMLLAVALAAGVSGPRFSSPTSSGLRPDDRAKPSDGTVLYTPLTYHHRVVGQAYLYAGTPSWIYVAVDDARTRADHVEFDVVRADGSLTTVGTIELSQGQGAWGGPTSVRPDLPSATALVSPCGRTLATGEFTRSSAAPGPARPRPQNDQGLSSGRGQTRASTLTSSRGAVGMEAVEHERDREHFHDWDRHRAARSEARHHSSGRHWTADRKSGSGRHDHHSRHTHRHR
jgi:hypothetical protein